MPAGTGGRRRWVAPDPRAAHRRNSRATSGSRPARRPGIAGLDGLRAVAVALVLVSHGGIPGVAGGFIGVDIFFVLSGFLITSLLLDELGRTGRIDLAGFWIRRARRLLPGLLVMVLAVAVGRELFPPDAITGLRNDAVAAFVWVANWSFIGHKTDYFTQGAAPSPLQHTWSLGVEEQYYLVWPLLLVAVAVLLAVIAGRRRRWVGIGAVRLAVFALAAAGAAASAVAAVMLVSHASLNRVYFGTDTRAQALLVGAAASALFVRDWSSLAVGWSLIRSRWAKWLARGLPIIGLVALGAAAHYATGSAAQFHRGLLIAVAVAAVAVVAPVALDQRGLVARVLALPPLVWLGTISYGIYLWHWPIFLAINGARTGASGLPLFVVRCIATLGVATASWWVIEHPIRRWRPVRVPMLRLAVATVATAIAVTLLVVPVGDPQGTLPSGVSTAALTASAPPVETLRPLSVPQQNGPRMHTVSVFGDSVAWTMMRYLPPTPGIKFIDNTAIGCGIVRGGPYRYQGQTLDQKPECDAWPDRWAQRIGYDRPDVVLLIIGRWETIDRVNEGHWTHIGDPAFDQYLTGELRRGLDILASTGARLVVTTEPYNRRGEEPDGSLYPEDDPDRVDEWNALLRRVIGNRPNVEVLDLNKKLCPGGYYTAKVNGVQMRADGVHPTPQAVKWLTPWLVDAVR
ncbi:acyltransferase family protein [Mycobacterium sp.]|uniref:acyltransferase family protein n=1 Tax=Mycobacterium sp. TaxID=1785 RepID=UPI002C95666F|nr:acyltransferase family protein [Mycobacterium sp.]HME46616.1 acyltransferase family protein [Mycobacterium sp.]